MLNSGFVNAAARNLSARLKKDVGTDRRKQVTRALQLVTGRAPTVSQIEAGLKFLKSFPEPNNPDQALEQFCLIALNLNEFVFVN